MLRHGRGDPQYIKLKLPQLQQQLDDYFDADFYTELSDLLTGTAVKGVDYLCAVTDSQGRTRFEYADSIGVVEVRAMDTDDGCEYVTYGTLTGWTKAASRYPAWLPSRG